MLPWLVKPAALVSVLGPPGSVIRRVWPAGTSPRQDVRAVQDERVRVAAGGGQVERRPGQDDAPVIVPPW